MRKETVFSNMGVALSDLRPRLGQEKDGTALAKLAEEDPTQHYWTELSSLECVSFILKSSLIDF